MKVRSWLFPALLLSLCVVSSRSLPQTGYAGKAVPVGPDDTQTRLAKRKIQPAPTAPPDYEGLLMADVNPGNTFKDEVIADFGSLGLWVYEQMVWHQISGTNPEWIMAVRLADAPARRVIVDLGAEGLWKWTYSGYPGDWKQISGMNALWAIAPDDDGDGRQELHVNFGPTLGVWRYDEGADGAASWKQISTFNPVGGLRTDLQPAGQEEGCFLIPKTGLWTISWADREPVYQQLTGMENGNDDFASAKIIGGEAEDLVMDLDAKGIWLCQNTDRTWYQISDKSPDRMMAVQFGGGGRELILDFNGDQGLYVWSFTGYPGTLTKLYPADPDFGFVEPFDPDGRVEKADDEELAIDFGTNGLWKYDFSRRTWTLLNTKNPEFMVAGDYWNEGSKATLAVDFGPDGLWLYEGRAGGWFKISGNSPDGGY